jgi:3-oxoacyl-(acyl-carrier-protein) synthase
MTAPADADVDVLATATWRAGAKPPPIAGFIVSEFSPLAAALADECLAGFFGAPPADVERGTQIAIVLTSSTGDLASAVAVARAVQDGQRVPPLLFFQSNPNAVAGYIAARWGLSGPVQCTVQTADPLADAMSSAALLRIDGAAQAALIIVADTPASGAIEGTAVLVGPRSWQQHATSSSTER